MRTTIDLPEDLHQPEDLHRAALLIARDRHQTLSRTVSDLLRTALEGGHRTVLVETDAETGMPLVRLGRRITTEDVATAQDEGCGRGRVSLRRGRRSVPSWPTRGTSSGWTC